MTSKDFDFDELVPAATMARALQMSRFTLAQSLRERRVRGVRRGAYWYVSLSAILEACERGTMLPPRALLLSLEREEV